MQDKHPRLVRWTHWLNGPFLALMIWSGLRIYWANDVYVPIPQGFFTRLGLDFHLAEGMAVHFFIGWLFALNGLAYVLYNALSGEWRELVPDRSCWKDAYKVVLHDLHVLREPPPQGRYNAMQRILYTGAVLMGAGLVLTGIAIYKPAQLSPLARVLGGYRAARQEHFALMCGLIAFALLHVAKVVEAGWLNLRSMVSGQPDEAAGPAAARVTRRALLTGGAAAALGGGAWAWILASPQIDGAPGPLRKVLDANGKLWRALFRPSCRAPEGAPVLGKEARQNGDLGLESELDPAAWRLRVEASGAASTLDLSDI